MQVVIAEIDAVTVSGATAAPIYLSDIGYVSLTGDPGGRNIYLPQLVNPLNDDSEMPIGPEEGTSVSANWGDIVFENPRNPDGSGAYDGLIDTLVVAGRPVIVRVGDKPFEGGRGIYTDPSVSTFTTLFQGVATGWETDGDTVSVAIRDNLSVLETPIQTSFYDGSGGAMGGDAINGQPIPKTRGQVLNVTPVVVDDTLNIYQVSDAAISGLTVYEGGAAVFTAGSNYATYALLAGATVASGGYATCTAGGYFRLGRDPVAAITCDVTGKFPNGSTASTPFAMALQLIQQDAGYSGMGGINTSSFSTLDASNAFTAGIYTGTEQVSTLDLIDQLLRALGGSVGAGLSGLVTAFQLAAPSGSPAFTWDTSMIMDVQPVDLPESVALPNWRRTVGYRRIYTVETDGLLGSVTASRRQLLSNEFSQVSWADSSIKTPWPTALDAPMVPSQLQLKANAQTCANRLGALWGVQRYLYDITLPRALLTSLVDFGTVGSVTYPIGKLTPGALVVAVGHSRDLQSDRVVQRVLV